MNRTAQRSINRLWVGSHSLARTSDSLSTLAMSISPLSLMAAHLLRPNCSMSLMKIEARSRFFGVNAPNAAQGGLGADSAKPRLRFGFLGEGGHVDSAELRTPGTTTKTRRQFRTDDPNQIRVTVLNRERIVGSAAQDQRVNCA